MQDLGTDTESEVSVESESIKTTAWAFGVNIGVATIKVVAGVLTGSSALLAEAVHSFADSSTEAFLLVGAFHGRRRPKARYAWALTAAIVMFALGGVYDCYEGIQTIFGTPVVSQVPAWIGLIVLAFASALESTSWSKAVRTLALTKGDKGWIEHLRTTTDTATKTILEEDTADIGGNILAGMGISMYLLTGLMVWQGIVSVMIGVLLMVMAYELGSHNVRLLSGTDAVYNIEAV
jgi:divalent metal cation (Fe/Co/Zn/Cd) transporter